MKQLLKEMKKDFNKAIAFFILLKENKHIKTVMCFSIILENLFLFF